MKKAATLLEKYDTDVELYLANHRAIGSADITIECYGRCL